MAASSNVVINGNTSVYDNGAKIGGFIAFNPSAGSPSVIINGTLTAEGNTATNNGQFIHGVKIATGKQDIVEVDKANIVYNDLDSWELEDIITGTTTINSHPEPQKEDTQYEKKIITCFKNIMSSFNCFIIKIK